MKIVFLEAQSIGDDIDLSGFDALGELLNTRSQLLNRHPS